MKIELDLKTTMVFNSDDYYDEGEQIDFEEFVTTVIEQFYDDPYPIISLVNFKELKDESNL